MLNPHPLTGSGGGLRGCFVTAPLCHAHPTGHRRLLGYLSPAGASGNSLCSLHPYSPLPSITPAPSTRASCLPKPHSTCSSSPRPPNSTRPLSLPFLAPASGMPRPAGCIRPRVSHSLSFMVLHCLSSTTCSSSPRPANSTHILSFPSTCLWCASIHCLRPLNTFNLSFAVLVSLDFRQLSFRKPHVTWSL